MNEYQALQQGVQMQLKSLKNVFEYQYNLPAVLTKLCSNTKKEAANKNGDKGRLVDRSMETVGGTDEEPSTERVS